MTAFEEISRIFRNKKHFELEVLRFSILENEGRDTSPEANAVKKITAEKETSKNLISKLNLWLATRNFDKHIKQLTDSVKKDIITKTDIVASEKDKTNYLLPYINEANNIIGNIITIIGQYPLSDKELISTVKYSNDILPASRELPVTYRLDLFEKHVTQQLGDFFSKINQINIQKPLKKISHISDELLLAGSLAMAVNEIVGFKYQILYSNKHIFKNYIVKNSHLPTFTLEKSEQTINPPETELISDKEIPLSETKPISDIVNKHIKPLSGYYQRQKIMTDSEFQRIYKYTLYLVEHEKIPKKIVPIKHTNISNEFIRKTFHLLHRDLYGRKKRTYWIDFLHNVFNQFKGTANDTTNKQFTIFKKDYEKTKTMITYK